MIMTESEMDEQIELMQDETDYQYAEEAEGMSETKLCCNCLHCARWRRKDGIETHCDLNDKYLGYLQVMEENTECKHWEKETKWDLQREHDKQIRADAIEGIKELVKSRLIISLGLEDATKYGNKNAKQQANSYATVMKYEIADCVDDLLDDLEQMKESDYGED